MSEQLTRPKGMFGCVKAVCAHVCVCALAHTVQMLNKLHRSGTVVILYDSGTTN